jgi:Ser/Thr protein kinase RdoA (MazF antagonist)
LIGTFSMVDTDGGQAGAADSTSQDTPFAGLEPDCVLDALALVSLQGDGRLIQLNSYENRVYQAFLDDGRVVVAKFYRPQRWSDSQISEEHRFVEQLAVAELPVAAAWPLRASPQQSNSALLQLLTPTLASFTTPAGPYRFSVAGRLSGRSPELSDTATLSRLGRLIGRIHAVGATERFEFRQTLNAATVGHASRDWLLAQEVIPIDSVAAWHQAADAALAAVDEAFERAGDPRLLRLHGDCHLGNILWATDGPQLVDFDDACTGPAMQDLWMLLAGERDAMAHQLAAVIDGYSNFMEFDPRELRLIEPLRTLRMLHHSAWIARRWLDPAFPIAFPWFAESAYWADQTVRLREQAVAMSEPPLILR